MPADGVLYRIRIGQHARVEVRHDQHVHQHDPHERVRGPAQVRFAQGNVYDSGTEGGGQQGGGKEPCQRVTGKGLAQAQGSIECRAHPHHEGHETFEQEMHGDIENGEGQDAETPGQYGNFPETHDVEPLWPRTSLHVASAAANEASLMDTGNRLRGKEKAVYAGASPYLRYGRPYRKAITCVTPRGIKDEPDTHRGQPATTVARPDTADSRRMGDVAKVCVTPMDGVPDFHDVRHDINIEAVARLVHARRRRTGSRRS
ncbi:hypothetical protein [Luteibacter sahnii]|uniref:hypothetical protein n=1 Tax=Luteibacter sahnii TaxID=3021977 RepID=UPI002A6B74EA|nr:hypothetical protein [Luteibacter sp. PPL193]MDY1548718.1 hypothetical protein [Luteibacter sp. PPL193]